MTSCHKCTQRELLSLLGKLNFAAGVVPSWRTFMRRLFDCAYSVLAPHHHLDLLASCRRDLQWRQWLLNTWVQNTLADAVSRVARSCADCTPQPTKTAPNRRRFRRYRTKSSLCRSAILLPARTSSCNSATLCSWTTPLRQLLPPVQPASWPGHPLHSRRIHGILG